MKPIKLKIKTRLDNYQIIIGSDLVKNLNSITNISAWLNRAMRNRCIDYLRKKKEILQEENSNSYKEPSERDVDIASLEIQSILKDLLWKVLSDNRKEQLAKKFVHLS